jgi:hypothetical protein
VPIKVLIGSAPFKPSFAGMNLAPVFRGMNEKQARRAGLFGVIAESSFTSDGDASGDASPNGDDDAIPDASHDGDPSALRWLPAAYRPAPRSRHPD